MTAKAALAMALLKGEVISIKTGFTHFGITNVPREISRGIEKPFGVTVSRTRKEGTTRYKVPCTWFEYRLNSSEHNLPGMKLMREYIQEQMGQLPPRTQKEAKDKKILDQIQMF